MAKAAISVVEWEGEIHPIYPVGAFTDWEFFTVPSGRHGPIELRPIATLATTTTHGFAAEADQLAEYFVLNVMRSIESLADPYGSMTTEDPFEYQSVPHRHGRTVLAKVRQIDRLRPIPIEDD